MSEPHRGGEEADDDHDHHRVHDIVPVEDPGPMSAPDQETDETGEGDPLRRIDTGPGRPDDAGIVGQ